MKYILLSCAFLAALGTADAQTYPPNSLENLGPARPKLMVGIVVDQMRWDYLYRFNSHFGSDGFRRLMNLGFRCEQTFVNYIPTYTAPGHTCVYTGSVPAIHGIAGNDWTVDGKNIYCTEDKSVNPVGGSWTWGQMSPKNLQTTTVTDELRLATNFRSRVFSVSLKDRSSILPGGHLANGVYWFDDSTGNFSSSTYYVQELPGWLKEFNRKHPVDSILSIDWKLSAPVSAYTQSTADNVPYEGKYDPKEPGTGFPHSAQYFKGTGAKRYNKIRILPAGNQLTLDLAQTCIKANELGKGNSTDFMALSLSATDYIGHQFGPNSMEIEDTYMRLDEQLGAFLNFLDNYVGIGNYTLFLTADHGAAHNSMFLDDHRIPGGNVNEGKWTEELNAFLKKETGRGALVSSIENGQVIFASGLSTNGLDSMKKLSAGWLRNRPEVAWVLDPLDPNTIPPAVSELVQNGYNPQRGGSLFVILNPGIYAGYYSYGTTHGAWNPYDRHIPLLWYGWGIKKGKTNREVHMTDIAATVAALLHIQMPNGCIGQVITEIVP